MLVITRKPNEKIMIGDAIEIVVLEIHGQRVRLGFRCPSEVPVHRAEVYNRIQQSTPSPPPEPDEAVNA